MSRGTASLGIVFPDGKQRKNTGKMCCVLSPAAEPRGALLCGNSHLAVPPHPHPPLTSCQSHPLAWWLLPLGFPAGGACPSATLGEQHRGLCCGRADLAGAAVRNSRAPAPLPAPCPADLVLTPQLTSWLLYIYFSPCPLCSLLSPCLSQRQQRCRTGSLSGHLPKTLV